MNGSERDSQWGEPPGAPRPRPLEQTSVSCRVLVLLPVCVTTAVPDSWCHPPMLHWSPRAQTVSVGLSLRRWCLLLGLQLITAPSSALQLTAQCQLLGLGGSFFKCHHLPWPVWLSG